MTEGRGEGIGTLHSVLNPIGMAEAGPELYKELYTADFAASLEKLRVRADKDPALVQQSHLG